MMKNVFKLLSLFALVSCKPQPPDLKEYINGWEYVTTFKTYPARSLTVVEKRAKIISGDNSVLVVELEKKPILKPNVSEPRDLHSYRFLFVELSLKDTLVSPAHLGSSRIIREIIAMSPQYGVNDLNPSEKIEIKKLTSNRWRVKSDLEDFQFEGEFSFADSSAITSKHKQMLND
jgi:hypothetical protein